MLNSIGLFTNLQTIVMDICDNWGEGSGLELWEEDCKSKAAGSDTFHKI